MEQREPVAVALTAERLGFNLSGDVPEWGFERDPQPLRPDDQP